MAMKLLPWLIALALFVWYFILSWLVPIVAAAVREALP